MPAEIEAMAVRGDGDPFRGVADRDPGGDIARPQSQVGGVPCCEILRGCPVEERLQDGLMVRLMQDERLKTRLLRFVDVLAALDFDRKGVEVKRLAQEYFDEPFPSRELPLELFLPQDGSYRVVYPEHLVVASDNLARSTSPAVIEQNEVLKQVQQPFPGKHAVQ